MRSRRNVYPFELSWTSVYQHLLARGLLATQDFTAPVLTSQHLHGCVHSGAANVPSLQQTPLAAVIQGEVNT